MSQNIEIAIVHGAQDALGLLGFSVLGWFRELLARVGAPWYVWLIAPIVLIAFLARKETEWIPDEKRRRQWSRWLVIGAIIVVILIAKFAPKDESPRPLREPQGRARVPAR